MTAHTAAVAATPRSKKDPTWNFFQLVEFNLHSKLGWAVNELKQIQHEFYELKILSSYMREKIIKRINIIATNLCTNHLGREKILLVNWPKRKSLNEFALIRWNLAGN